MDDVAAETTEVLADLGVVEPILAQGWSRDIRVRRHVGGKLLADLHLPGRDPHPQVPYPYPVLIPQWRTEQILRARLEILRGGVEPGQELQDLPQDASGMTATVRHTPTGRTRQIRSRCLIGCEGARSRVRKPLGTALIGDTRTEHFALGDAEVSGLDPEAAHVRFDAAHLHGPAGGQGMNTGIRDACNLDRKLALVLHGRPRSTCWRPTRRNVDPSPQRY